MRVPKALSLFQRLDALEAQTRDKTEARALLVEVDRQLRESEDMVLGTTEAVNTESASDSTATFGPFAGGSVARRALERGHAIVNEAMAVTTFDGDGRPEVKASKEALKVDIKRACSRTV